MLRKKYTAEFKTKIVLSILQGDKVLYKFNKKHIGPHLIGRDNTLIQINSR